MQRQPIHIVRLYLTHNRRFDIFKRETKLLLLTLVFLAKKRVYIEVERKRGRVKEKKNKLNKTHKIIEYKMHGGYNESD